MRTLFALLLLAAPLVAAPVPKAKPADPVDGDWEVVERTLNGKASKGAAGVVWAIRGDELVIRPQGAKGQPLANTQFKLTRPEKGKKGEVDYQLNYTNGSPTVTYRGLFEVDGDTLRVGYTTDPTADRPTAFDPKEKVVVYTFRRVPDPK